ncbi:AraC family transcriptional regulator [Pseudomonas caspiana]|uniref:HTH araC/xylS-type domain-containing protein n=1 Tax=Pseudomonas caspiana TaxID=1451454 RepID=A0A1Y3P448_9PSED|nr:AraC family transcriptional regulator [Pseudomonas caspiana]OUM71564.1 hypothetical protein AUC60_22490 [Pseudomonas caspiana]
MQSISLTFARALASALCTGDERMRSIAVEFEKEAASCAATHLPMSELCRFFDQTQLRSGNEDLGLLAYQKAHPGHLGVLGYAIMSSPTLGDAMTRMVEHHSMIGTGFCMFLDSSATTLRIAGLSADTQSDILPRAFVDAVAAITLGLLHWLTPSVLIRPVRAEFTYEKPRDTRQLEQLFGPDLRFSCVVNAMTFQRSDADFAVATFDPSLQQLHDNYLKRRQDELPTDSTVVKIKRAILQHLNQAKPIGMADIAQTLGMSTHQLIRTLEKDEQSFQKLVDIVKKQHSHQLLMNTTLSLKQVSYNIGFKHPSAFNKACERWFGMSPGSYRSSKQL